MTVVLSPLDRARNKAAAGGVVTMSQAMAPKPKADQSGALWQQYAATHVAGKAKEADVGGWKGFVGDVLDNSIVKTVLKPLEVLDYGRRIVVSAVNETADAFNGGDASFGDFFDQVKDPTFGFGKVIGSTGNKWFDRAIGFIGDVALDPLTYVGLHGLHEFAGQAGRFNLARTVLDSAKLNPLIHTAEHIAAVEGKAAAVAKMGRAALTAEDVGRLGLERSGFYMFGKRLPHVRIPGTGVLADMTESGLSKLRLSANDTALVKAFQRGFTPNDYRDIRVALARGEVPTEAQGLAIRIVTSRDTQRAAQEMSLGAATQRIHGAIEAGGKSELESFRKTVYKVMEGGTPASAAEAAAAQRWTDILTSFWDDVSKGYKKADPTSTIGKVDNYFPRMATDEAEAFWKAGKTDQARRLRDTFERPVDAEAIFDHRVLKTGSDFFGVKLTEAQAASTFELNKIANAAGFKGEFFHTDVLDVMEKYSQQYAAQMGTVARLEDLVSKSNVIEAIQKKAVTTVVTDEKALKDTKAAVVGFDNARKKAFTNVKDSLQAASDGVFGMRATALETLGDLTKAADGAGVVAAKRQVVLDVARRNLNDASVSAEEAKAALTSLFVGGEVPPAAQSLVAQWDATLEELRQLEPLLEAAHKAEAAAADGAVVAREGVVEVRDAMAEFDTAAQAVGEKVEKLVDNQQDALNYNQLIADNMDAIVNGGDLSFGTAKKAQREALISAQKIAADGGGSGNQLAGLARPFTEGSRASQLQAASKNADWWSRAQRVHSIPVDKVKAFTRDKFRESIAIAIRDGGDDVEGSITAALWQRADAERFFQGDLPPALSVAHENLSLRVETADVSLTRAGLDVAASKEAKAQAKALKSGGANAGTSAAEQQAKALQSSAPDMAAEVTSFAEQHSKFVTVRKGLSSKVAENPDAPVTPEMMDAVVALFGADTVDAAVSKVDDAAGGVSALEAHGAGLKNTVSAATVAQGGTENAIAFSKALDEVALMPKGTVGELDAAMAHLVKALEDRTWRHGNGPAAREFTIRNAKPKGFRADAESDVARYARAMTAMGEAGGRDAAPIVERSIANETLAEAATYADITQELHKRFQMLSHNQFTYGHGIVSRAAVDEIARKIVADWRPLWAAKAGEEVGGRVVGKLDSFAAGVSDELYGELLRGHATRFADEVPEVFRDGSNGLSRGARRQLDGASDAKMALTQNPLDPTTHAMALNDQATVRALDELAGVNLWEHTTPNGNSGFIMPDGTVATLRNGDPLIFTRAESDALYGAARVPFKDPQGKVYTAADIPKRLESVDGLIDEVAAKTDKVTKILENNLKARQNGLEPMPSAKRAQFEAVLAQNEKAIQELQRTRSVLVAQAESADPATLERAMNKAQVLVNGNGTQPGWFQAGAAADGAVDPTVVVARREALQAEWAASPAARHLDEVSKITEKANEIAYKDAVTNPGAVEEHAAEMIKAAHVADPGLDERLLAARSVAEQADALVKTTRTARRGMSSQKEALGRQVEKLEKAMETSADRAATSQLKAGERQVKTAVGAKIRKEPAVLKAQTSFDAAEAIRVNAATLLDVQQPALREQIVFAQELIDAHGGLMQRVGKRKMTEAELADVSLWVDDALDIARTLDPNDPITTTLFQAVKAEGDYLLADVALTDAKLSAGRVASGWNFTAMVDDVQDGFTSLAKIGLPGMKMPDAAAEMLMNVKRAEMPVVAKALNDFMGKYTAFFKAYATLSPGFHVRNAMSNTFSLFAAGGDPKNLRQGLVLYRDLMKDLADGVEVEAWLAKISARDAVLGAQADIAVRSMSAAGGGAVEEALVGFISKSHTLTDNFATRGSRRLGGKVEGSARFMLGFDGARQGLDFQSATTRVKRFLFDYTDVGTADMAMRQVIPFWMWMSRNLPVTLVNQWANPKPYAIYQSFARNLGTQVPDGEIVPNYLEQQGGIRMAEDWWLTPDVGFTRAQQQVAELGDFGRLASYINPGLRVPLELMGDKKYYNGAPFSDKPQQMIGGGTPVLGGALEALAGLLGQTSQNRAGETQVTDKFNYALMNTLPPLAQLERVFSPQSAGYQDRAGNSRVGYLGIPVKHITEGMKESERKRREFEAKDARAKARREANG